MIYLGLTGFPLSHSLSPRLHNAALKALNLQGKYELYPISPDDKSGFSALLARLREGELRGLNVTIPHKQTVLSYLDDLSSSARAIGAVNTIILEKGKLIGHNTDAPGFLADLYRSFPNGFLQKHAMVLGAGGAARAVVYALIKDGWSVTLSVRKADVHQAAELIDSFRQVIDGNEIQSILMETGSMLPYRKSADLIVNATPLGMSPSVEYSPWPEELAFFAGAAVYDLVYNPRQTTFLRQAGQAGLRTASGIGMLVEQAALSFEIWTGKAPPRDVMFSQVEEK
jgi:shikimate dehydrogenase